MKVLHYVNENDLSWAKPFLQLLRYFESSGIENVILCPEGGTLPGQASDSGIEVIHYKPAFSNIPLLCRNFVKIAGSVEADLIHTRLSSAAYIASEWKERLGLPVLSTVDKYAKLKYYRKADHLVAVSTGVKNWSIKQGYPEERISVIGNPLDISFYESLPDMRNRIRSQEGIAPGTKIIFAAGRFVKWKGLDILLNACEMVLKDEDCILWIAGDGPELEDLKSIVRSSDLLREKVKFWGFVNDVRPFMWSSDLFVLPSREPEPFGLVLLEAMACSLPVIATSAGGPLDIVQEGMGWLVPPDDMPGMKEAIQEALRDSNITDKASASKERALMYDVKAIGTLYIQQYKSLLKESSLSGGSM